MGDRSTCPYNDLPASSFWSKAVSGVGPEVLDFAGSLPYQISPSDKIATAGSCFAQHISRYLAKSGFKYFVTEPAPNIGLSPALRQRYNYGTFSARYGNIYTTRQLCQLFDRAYGAYSPADTVWRDGANFIDPYRPQIQPNGFDSEAELTRDRAYHFAAVRRLFETLDIFIFTLGLTETYMARADGAVYPIAPGCGAGRFDPAQHVFVNLDYEQIVSDLDGFIARLRTVNAEARIILTVSPVPLIATAEARHVAVSTAYSKSVLRAAAGRIADRNEHVTYFPSYELITHQATARLYYEADYRTVREAGVAHVMRMFFRHYCGIDEPQPIAGEEVDAADIQSVLAQIAVICEEELLATEATD